MKQIKLLILFTLSFMVLVTSCSDEGPVPQNPDEEPDDTPTNTDYYINYKIGGVLVSMEDSKGLRGKEGEYNTLKLEGSGKDGVAPKFKFYHSGSFIGIVDGLNIGSIDSQNSDENYLEITTKEGVHYSTKNDPEGCYLAISSEVIYAKDGTVEGTFSGFVSSSDSKRLEITEGRYKVKFAD